MVSWGRSSPFSKHSFFVVAVGDLIQRNLATTTGQPSQETPGSTSTPYGPFRHCESRIQLIPSQNAPFSAIICGVQGGSQYRPFSFVADRSMHRVGQVTHTVDHPGEHAYRKVLADWEPEEALMWPRPSLRRGGYWVSSQRDCLALLVCIFARAGTSRSCLRLAFVAEYHAQGV